MGSLSSNSLDENVRPEALLYRYGDSVHSRWLVLDRDGTLSEDSGYTYRESNLRLRPGVARTLSALAGSGWGFAIATNQSGLARGYFEVEEMERFNDALCRELKAFGVTIEAIAICPHHPDGMIEEWRVDCGCRKPAPGLILTLASNLGFELNRTVFAGNSITDEGAAAAAQIRFRWARNEHEWSELESELAVSL